MLLLCSLSERGPGEGVRVSMTSSRGLATAAMLLVVLRCLISGVDFVWKKRSRERAAVVVDVAEGLPFGVVERERAGREGVTLLADAWPKRRGER